MTILQDDSGMVDADLGEMVGPDPERLTVRYGEGKVVQVLSCRFSRLSIELFGSRSSGLPSTPGAFVSTITTFAPRCLSATYPMRAFSAKGTSPSAAVYQRALASTSVTRSWKWESPVIGGTGYRLVDFCHVFFNFFTPRTLSTASQRADYARAGAFAQNAGGRVRNEEGPPRLPLRRAPPTRNEPPCC